MKIRNNLIYSFIFTFAYIAFYIWNRFIRTRLPREINYHDTLTFFDKIIILLFLCYLFLFIYYALKYFKIIPRPKSKFRVIRDKFLTYLESKKIIMLISQFFSDNVMDGPKNVYEFFYTYIYIRPFIRFCGNLLHSHFQDRPFLIYICGFILPKIIIVSSLFIEVIFANRLYYFYYCLILYLIPLLFKIILYIIEHHAKGCLDVFQEYFSFKLNDDMSRLVITFKPFIDPVKEKEQDTLYPQAERDWLKLQFMYSIVAKIHIEKNKYQIITDIIIYSLYVISFGTYLLKILGIV